MLNTVTFGMYSGQQQGAAGGKRTDAEGAAKQAGDAAQQTVDSAKVTSPWSASLANAGQILCFSQDYHRAACDNAVHSDCRAFHIPHQPNH